MNGGRGMGMMPWGTPERLAHPDSPQLNLR